MLPRPRRLSALVVAALTLTAAPSYGGNGFETPPSAAPQPAGQRRLLAHDEHGAAAVRALGGDLDVAARRTGWSSAELAHTLRTDHTAWVDTHGRVYYRDEAPAAPTTAAAPDRASYPYEQTFLLHSRPGSAVTIYLDFKGGDVSGTIWQANGDAISSVPAFDLDGTAGFSTTEQDLVQEVWARVSTAYAPFDIDVTTEQPSHDALFLSSAADPTYGTVAMISNDSATSAAVCGQACGGMAYIGVLDNPSSNAGAFPYYEPAMVLGDMLWNDAGYIALATEHELGHNLGLRHDGRNGAGYDSGVGGWGPVMGAPYGMPLVQFSNGEYAGADNLEDDFAVADSNGAHLVTDDFGDSAQTAKALVPTGTTASVTGLITTRDDQDTVSFSTDCTGTVTLDLTPTGEFPTLDARLRLLSADGTQIASADPPMSWTDPTASGLDAHLSVSVGPGTYVAEVDGVGASTATTTYSDYGSVGAWSLQAGACFGTPPTTTPSAPTAEAVTWDAQARSATLTWAPPDTDHGFPVTAYVVQAGAGAPVTVDAMTLAHTFTGLTGGTPYTFSVAAVNSTGTGAAALLATTSPAMPYSAPRQVTVTDDTAGRDGYQTVSWLAPADLNGNPAPASYAVAVTGDFGSGTETRTVQTTLLSTSVTGLVDGHTYAVTVTAHDPTTGDGDASAPVQVGYHLSKPATPTGLGIVAGQGVTTLTWSGVPGAVAYDVTRDGTDISGTGPYDVSVDAATLSVWWSNLRPGQTYHVTVTARDVAGHHSDPAALTFVARTISQPRAVGVLPMPKQSVLVAWDPPSYAWQLDHYQVRISAPDASMSRTTTRTDQQLDGLVTGTSYAVQVRGVDSYGYPGAWSDPVSFVYAPPVAPGRPGIRTPLRGAAGGRVTATARWTAPAKAGTGPVTGYTIEAIARDRSGRVVDLRTATAKPGARSKSMRLKAGLRYRFKVAASNSAGRSRWSALSDAVVPR